MPLAPVIEIGWAVRLDPGRAQHPMLPLVPVLSRAIDPVGCELVDDQQRRECGQRVEPFVERVHVMEPPACDHRIPFALELLELCAYKPLAFRRMRIDAEHVVARTREQLDE